MSRKGKKTAKPKAKPDAMSAFTRRTFIGAGVFAAAAVIGCETLNTGPIMEVLPDGDEDGLPVLPQNNLKPPVANPVAASNGIIPRSSWAHGGPIMSRITPLNGVQYITFHHSGDSNPFTATDTASVAVHLESIRQFHTNPVTSDPKTTGRAWGDIAYHFGIDPAGRIWELRSLQYQGSHVKGRNPHNVGVCVLGNFSKQPMNAAQQATIKSFGAQLRKKFAVPLANVYAHREIGQTDCPGTAMYPFIVSIRSKGLI